jgi:hypothetical protein
VRSRCLIILQEPLDVVELLLRAQHVAERLTTVAATGALQPRREPTARWTAVPGPHKIRTEQQKSPDEHARRGRDRYEAAGATREVTDHLPAQRITPIPAMSKRLCCPQPPVGLAPLRLVAAFVAREIVLPLVLAIVLKLLLQPALRILEGLLHLPRTVASLLLILALFGTIVALGTVISGPARTWAAKLPEGIPPLQERLGLAHRYTATVFLQRVEDFGGTEPSPNGATLTRPNSSVEDCSPGSGILRPTSL